METKFSVVCLIIAMIGIVAFWAFGFSGQMTVSAISFFTAGVAAFFCLASEGIAKLRRYRRGF